MGEHKNDELYNNTFSIVHFTDYRPVEVYFELVYRTVSKQRDLFLKLYSDPRRRDVTIIKYHRRGVTILFLFRLQLNNNNNIIVCVCVYVSLPPDNV